VRLEAREYRVGPKTSSQNRGRRNSPRQYPANSPMISNPMFSRQLPLLAAVASLAAVHRPVDANPACQSMPHQCGSYAITSKKNSLGAFNIRIDWNSNQSRMPQTNMKTVRRPFGTVNDDSFDSASACQSASRRIRTISVTEWIPVWPCAIFPASSRSESRGVLQSLHSRKAHGATGRRFCPAISQKFPP
jgi:hypothetical protein